MDVIAQLGPLTLASRLRRLAELLYKDGSRVYHQQSVDFEPHWFPLFFLLSEWGSVSISEAAKALGLSHPAIVQIANQMRNRGLIESTTDRKDERKNILLLTRQGKSLLSLLKPIWTDIETAARNLITEAGGDFLISLGRIEEAFRRAGIYERALHQAKKRQLEKVEIIDYKPGLKRYFKSLNLEWLKEYFAVEKADEQILSDPHGEIIKHGGLVLFAKLDGKIVGTVALIRHDVKTFELTKMSVAKKVRGHQIGRKLALTALERAKSMGAKKMVLLTSPKLAPANNLYRSLGFVEAPIEQLWVTPYQRASIVMSLRLKTKKTQKPKRRYYA
jgi:predicted N-acetyltransferase YhbS/DNA-binding MarR family transcriptional regulator